MDSAARIKMHVKVGDYDYYNTALYYETRKRHRLHDVEFYRAHDVDDKRLDHTS